MTTIAYRDGVLAADTLACWGDSRDGHFTKIAKVGALLACASGNMAGCQAFLDWFRAGATGEPPSTEPGDKLWFGLIVMPDDLILTWTPNGWERTRAPYVAMGSGAEFAKGAMEVGATAEQAVTAAIVHDTKSGGVITVLRR